MLIINKTKKINVGKIKKILISISLIFIFNTNMQNINIMYLFTKNFGDNLNKFLLKDMIKGKLFFYNRSFRRPDNQFWDQNNIKKLNEIAKIDLFFIGSILDTVCNWSYIFRNKNNEFKSIISKWYYKIIDYFYPLVIFGTGFISRQDYQNESYIRNLKVIAVRGNITLQRLKRNGVKIPNNVVLADPGILAPMLLNNSEINETTTKKKYNLCIIPHYIDMKKNNLIKKQVHIKNSIILNIKQNPYKLLKSIKQCKSVLSSGLHGLIIADSFGISNMRMVVSDKISGGDYKFIDYYSAYGIQLPPKIDLRKEIFTERNLQHINSLNIITKDIIKKKQCELLNSFPFKLTEKYERIKNNICR